MKLNQLKKLAKSYGISLEESEEGIYLHSERRVLYDSYITLLHELGHAFHPLGDFYEYRKAIYFFGRIYQYTNPSVVMIEEISAWIWAKRNYEGDKEEFREECQEALSYYRKYCDCEFSPLMEKYLKELEVII